ncbi:phosphoglycerol transferase MdoB-like AlkP superfamily enzyme [Natranaerovirga hydrolytica]|uniref:Phosphoglycerol transferase MdoB-like AlkP superfamily enzyme n=1 Tax=Natranaerovirga hydrolytica TaxID=680378 RepID=A0A4R1M9I1_9FIRM|nr:LTA synthase family protein [Natranaerovirga hydrolytica]TCK88040.1 phosphoglycerol transferase MdoB-like AlkP superfamily enzyme [Natranaerovirga hydrolytica]
MRFKYRTNHNKEVFNNTSVFYLIALAIILNVFLELSMRRSFLRTIVHITSSPFIFIYNILIIFTLLSVSLVCLRRRFFLVFVSTIGIGIGIANFILLGYRTTPLSASDLYIFRSVLGIINIYVNTTQMILIFALLMISIILLVVAWNRLPKHSARNGKAFMIIAFSAFFIFNTVDISSARGFANLVDAYDDYGFAYSFSTTLMDSGIDRPDDYSEEHIEKIRSGFDSNDMPTTDYEPNIIMVQLESFFDVNYIKDLTFSENPVPNFTKLKQEYSSGFLTVPSIGAGTANTEFEILSGMSLEHFGLGEYPYKTVLQSSSIETMAYNLEELGYKSHALHNNTISFYNRDLVFPNLGFHTFTSIEYMNNVEYNPVGWAKDEVLLPEIIKTMNSTKTKDFVFAMSVQPHGIYPNEEMDYDQPIKVVEASEDFEVLSVEYFINQLYEVDQFIGNLIAALDHYDEPVVLVLYGDHLPSLGIENEHLENGNVFETEYIMWSNFPMANQNVDLSAYQLSAYIMKRLGYDNGNLTKFHNAYGNKDAYQEHLLMLQYDMLFGEQYIYNGNNPYNPMNMSMGTSSIKITQVEEEKNNLRITGENFTPWSVVYINGEAVETVFIDSKNLLVEDENLQKGMQILVAQVNDDQKVLSQTEHWIYK